MSADRLAVVGPATWQLFVPLLQQAFKPYELECQVDAYGVDREAALWSGADEEFEQNPPRGVFVMPESRVLFREFTDNPRTTANPVEQAHDAARLIIASIAAIAARHPQISWVVCTADGMHPGSADAVADPAMDSLAVAVDEFNRRLCDAVRSRPGWSIFDRRRLSAALGAQVLQDARLELLGRFPASSQGMRLLAERLAAHWVAVRGKMKKVLCLDCDNTLWGGVVGEDGVDGIQLGDDGAGRAYSLFQKAILAIESRGELLALCTRNEPADVEAVFEKRAEMLIPRDRISAAEIGWNPKSEGLKRLAERLGLGLADFVFVDDNPAEREQVRQALPEVTVPDFPKDPADLAAFAYDLGWRHFYRLALTAEDQAKTEQYRSRAQFVEQSEAAPSPDQFLESLRMKARLAVDSAGLVARCAQLTQKTNQFNLTLRRYTEAEIRNMMSDPACAVIAGSLEDRFGNQGWIALAILKLSADKSCWEFDAFLMSCRVLGRSFELAFAKACVDHVRSRQNLPVRAEFIPGQRNAQVNHFYDKLGFRVVVEAQGGGREYALEGDVDAPPQIRFTEILWE